MTSTFIVKVTNPKFRITIPSDIREIENIEQNDFLEVTISKKKKQ